MERASRSSLLEEVLVTAGVKVPKKRTKDYLTRSQLLELLLFVKKAKESFAGGSDVTE